MGPRTIRLGWAALLGLMLATMAGLSPARAQAPADSIEQRLERVERQLERLSREVEELRKAGIASPTPPPPPSAALPAPGPAAVAFDDTLPGWIVEVREVELAGTPPSPTFADTPLATTIATRMPLKASDTLFARGIAYAGPVGLTARGYLSIREAGEHSLAVSLLVRDLRYPAGAAQATIACRATLSLDGHIIIDAKRAFLVAETGRDGQVTRDGVTLNLAPGLVAVEIRAECLAMRGGALASAVRGLDGTTLTVSLSRPSFSGLRALAEEDMRYPRS